MTPLVPGHEVDTALANGSLRAWVRRRLTAWFAKHARQLPWRRDRDAYRIWVSEVMLQQTQVRTVIPYFERFLARFPNLASLAAADEHEILLFWQGLGYYRRARDLHRAARSIVADHAGQLPSEPAALAGLPGFGRYTVNAVLSQAFDLALPIVEANSQRVLARFFGVRGDTKQGSVQKLLWHAAEVLLPRRHVGRFNQALMELGALVCKPERPECSHCPLARHCFAHVHGLQAELPTPARRVVAVQVDEVAVVLRRGERVLLLQRAPQGRWGNLWEFPHVALEFLEAPQTGAARLLQTLGLVGAIHEELTTIRHTVTRFRITLVCLAARHTAGEPAFAGNGYVRSLWLRPSELPEYPLSTPQRRLARFVAEGDSAPVK